MRRAVDVGRVLVRRGLQLVGAVERDRRSPVPPLRPEGAFELRRALQDLGPTYVKIGQLLSTRADLLPDGYQRELAHLQSQVPPFPLRYRKQITVTRSRIRQDSRNGDPSNGALGSPECGDRTARRVTRPDLFITNFQFTLQFTLRWKNMPRATRSPARARSVAAPAATSADHEDSDEV